MYTSSPQSVGFRHGKPASVVMEESTEKQNGTGLTLFICVVEPSPGKRNESFTHTMLWHLIPLRLAAVVIHRTVQASRSCVFHWYLDKYICFKCFVCISPIWNLTASLAFIDKIFKKYSLNRPNLSKSNPLCLAFSFSLQSSKPFYNTGCAA